MNIIVAVDKNWGIGLCNKLLISIPADMKFFRETTTKKVVIMGRKTVESFPNGQPLKDRINVIITKDKNYKLKEAIVVHSVEEALEAVKDYATEDVYVIGGESIYRQMLPYCNMAHVTKIDHVYEADTFFPNLEEEKDWILTGESEEQTYFDLEYTFARYEKL